MPGPLQTNTTAVFWLRIAALALVVAGLGLPVNDLFRYALLVIAAVAILAGEISCRPARWLAALGVVALTAAAAWLWPAPRIEEGHNLFVVDGPGGALERGLPADAFRQMAAEFDARHPPESRCQPQAYGCWRGSPFPDRAFAFSTDSTYSGALYSRRVTGIDFADPVWLRLGFSNEAKYNWTGQSDLQRAKRNRFWVVLHPWQLTMPFFVMYRFPADFVGSQLCWRGLVLWEEAGERFAVARHADFACQPIERGDVGRRIFGVSVASPLAMTLEPPLPQQLRRLVEPGLALLAAGAVLLLLVRLRRQQLVLPFVFIALSLLVVLLNDSSFIGGVRPFEGGDDGLVYEGLARRMVQHVLNGDIAQALEGGEKVFFYGGPGLRYFRTVEHFIFGDTFLGYLSLILALPFVVFAAFRRFFDPRSALGLTLIFIIIPVGAVFGTSFFHYTKWAVRGFADPAAAIVFLAGFVVLLGSASAGPGRRFAPALGAGLLFALALWLRPNLAPGAGVLLGGAGLAALWQMQIARVAGLCLGFLPVLGMALHNWVFGGVFVLFSGNITEPANFPTPPSIYVAALGDLVRMDFAAGHVTRVLMQIAGLLAGPSEFRPLAPLGAAAVVILLRVALCRRGYDPWLRLTAGAALALHSVALFYPTSGRYHYLAWLLTLVVSAVWMREEGLNLWRRWLPRSWAWFGRHSVDVRLARLLDRLASIAGVAPPPKRV